MQRRATKVSHALKGLKYDDRLNDLNLTTLEKRRTRGDLIQKFKIEKGLDTVEWENPPHTVPPRGGRRSQLQRELVRNCAQRYNFFNNRIVNEWNSLPDSVTQTTSTN